MSGEFDIRFSDFLPDWMKRCWAALRNGTTGFGVEDGIHEESAETEVPPQESAAVKRCRKAIADPQIDAQVLAARERAEEFMKNHGVIQTAAIPHIDYVSFEDVLANQK